MAEQEEPGTATAAASDSAFWAFTLAVYGRPGVAPACLGLQDRHGLDVNLLMFCCWVAVQGLALDQHTLRAADEAVAGWRNQVVKPLRGLRRRLKRDLPGFPADEVAALRRRILDVELETERLAQSRLEQLLPASSSDEAAPILAVRGLRLCFRLQGVDPDDVDDRDCLALLVGVFPDLDPQSLGAALRN